MIEDIKRVSKINKCSVRNLPSKQVGNKRNVYFLETDNKYRKMQMIISADSEEEAFEIACKKYDISYNQKSINKLPVYYFGKKRVLFVNGYFGYGE